MSQKVALVTGGSTGIGRAIARSLATDGFAVVITGRNEETLQESASQHEAISHVVADVTQGADAQRTLEEVQSRHGRLDVLVNNAGVAPMLPLAHVTPDHVDAIFDVNVKGLIATTQAALPLLRESKGSIINVSSILGDRPIPNISVYAASKGAVNTLGRAWARELAPEGIRVNTVSPGPIDTPIYDKHGLSDEEKEAMGAQIAGMVPLGRFGTSEEVAGVVSLLASEEAGFVTGAQYVVDGGMGA